jgi:energy-coupling factor transporter ATP-binding protein EcfA2
MGRQLELRSVQIANLRGFRDATLPLSDGLTLLVGANNSGKTSILRILNWILNEADESTLMGDAQLTERELRLLLPARETRNAARRLVLGIRVLDGRRRSRFQCVGDTAHLRVSLTLPGNVRLNIGPPRRGETADWDDALPLLDELRGEVSFTLVPASRDAQSRSFTTAFRSAVLAKLHERAVHSGRAGAPIEYRKVKRALEEIRGVADGLVLPVWDEVKGALPPGMAESADVSTNLEPRALAAWIADRTLLRITTGEHDKSHVEPDQVGSGLQSLLELALQQTRKVADDVDRIIAVEEPEAFLHPSAQRTLARMVAAAAPGSRIVSTHSPILVEEARFGETVLVRDHRFYPPASLSDDAREAINTALLAGAGAEMAFARSVLLVEGEGDAAFYETLRRRLARASADGRVDQLVVVGVGSKSAFAPWLRMLSSYGSETDRPIRWLIAADGDAATQIRRAHSDAGLRLPLRLRSALSTAANQRHNPNREVFTAATNEVNAIARQTGAALHLSPIDLEHAALHGCDDDVAASLARAIRAPVSTREDLETWLRGRKAPHLRSGLAIAMEWSIVSPDTRAVLRRWLEPVMTRQTAQRIVRSSD